MFLVTLPLAVVALVMAWLLVPAHVNESTEPVDNLGGVLSVVLVGALILAINFAPVPNEGTLALGLVASRSRRWSPSSSGSAARRNPLYDLDVAARRDFWVAACAGIIVFGSLMGAMFIGQQFLQNVLDYSTLEAGRRSFRPPVCMVLVAPRSAKLVEAHGARFTLLLGYVFVLLGFLTMLLLWKEDIAYWKVGLGYALHRDRRRVRRHARVALADRLGPGPRAPAWRPAPPTCSATSAARSCSRSSARCSPPATPAAAAAAIAASPDKDQVTDSVQAELTKSFSSAADIAERTRSTRARSSPGRRRRSSRATSGPTSAGIIAVLLGAALVFFLFPKRDEESGCSPPTTTGTAAPRP